MEESTFGLAASKTASYLADTEKKIAEINNFQQALAATRTAELRSTIRIIKKSANFLLLTAHASLHNKIAYEQQRRALARQKAILADWAEQQILWTSILKKAKEQRKQLKRLQKVQQEYEVASASPGCNQEYKAGLEEKMIRAMERSVRAQKAYGGTLAQLKVDVSRMQDNSEWHQKQVDLDDKALERAKEAARRAKERQREKLRSDKLEEEKVRGNEWLPEQYKAKGRKEDQCQEQQVKGKRKARQ